MAGKHTPGPWVAMRGTESTGRQVADWAITVDDHDTWICTGPTWDAEYQAESFANARLIAAAPDLLDVLMSIQADQSWRTNDNSLWPRINEVVRRATQPLPSPNEE